MNVGAVILGGARNSGKLSKASDEQYEAFIEVAGRPMISFIMDAAAKCACIGRVVVVAPVRELEAKLGPAASPKVTYASCGETLLENVQIGVNVLQGFSKVLIMSSDVPLVNERILEDLVNQCLSVEAQFCYPIIPKSISERKFPGVKRTYVRVKEGVFTGGNLVLLDREVVDELVRSAVKVIEYRKNPLKLGGLLGWGLIFKLIFGLPKISEIEHRASRVFGVSCKAIVCMHPEVGFDVDKPEDLTLVNRLVSVGHKL